MRIVRKAHRNSAVFWLLAIVIALRSFVAPGFMLNVDEESPLGISITLCGGWTGSEQLDVFDDIHAMHKGGHPEQHDHQTENGLTSSTECGVWSTSSTFVQAVVINLDNLLDFGSDAFRPAYHTPYYRVSFQNPQQPRAPPLSRHI
jgi:hypothetical protein